MKTYLVGGAVRDQLLQFPVKERDWVVVGATPEHMLAQGYQPVGKDFPVFLHPQTREEYALARTERKSGKGYTGFVCHADPDVTLEQDLERRDLTINAMAQDDDGTIIDPYHGRQDLEAKQLRHVSPAFVEDPLRILRVARFAARYAHLGFSVAEETLQVMQDIVSRQELDTLPAERIWKEFEKALGERSPEIFIQVLEDCGALGVLMPELDNVSDNNKSLLQHSGDSELPAHARFALLFFNSNHALVTELCHRLKAPNEFRKLATMAAELAGSIITDIDSAEELLDVIEKADAFRNPTRFFLLLDCCTMASPQTTTPDKLRQSLAACQNINAADIAAQGFTGKAMAREIRKHRIHTIQQQLAID